MKRCSTTTDRTVDPDVLAYTVGDDVTLDLALAVWDCMGTAAHVTMLSEMKLPRPVVTKREAAAVRRELGRIARSAQKGDFRIELEDQDVHMAVERLLTARLGDLGKKIHTGRSRNDQVAVDVRLHMKSEIAALEGELAALAIALAKFGEKGRKVPLVGRTHLQSAMPSSVWLWATGHMETLVDLAEGLEAAYRLSDLNPLGSAAGYGVPLPLDRARTTELLGFSRTISNCFGASIARGECEAALLGALALLMAALSRLAQDIILYSLPEMGYFSIPREFCTGSSIMPQKFNPDVLELVRGKAAQVIGLHTASLALLHAMSGGYNRDLQDCKGLYMQGLATTRRTLRILTKVAGGLKFDAKRCREGFTPGVFATDVALRMVAAGTPWRDAYHAVRDHLEILENENPDEAIAAKSHEGTTGDKSAPKALARARALGVLSRRRKADLEAAARRLLR